MTYMYGHIALHVELVTVFLEGQPTVSGLVWCVEQAQVSTRCARG